MRSITTSDLQYAHRSYDFKGETQYLRGYTDIPTLEVEDAVNAGVNMVLPCNEIQKTVWEVLKNPDYATILREDDPLPPALLGVYGAQGIKDGASNNIMKGPAFKTDLAAAYPEYHPVVTKETTTMESMIKIVYDLLRDKLSIVRVAFISGIDAASKEFKPRRTMECCPLCGTVLDESSVCPKCSYRKWSWYGKRETGMIQADSWD